MNNPLRLCAAHISSTWETRAARASCSTTRCLCRASPSPSRSACCGISQTAATHWLSTSYASSFVSLRLCYSLPGDERAALKLRRRGTIHSGYYMHLVVSLSFIAGNCFLDYCWRKTELHVRLVSAKCMSGSCDATLNTIMCLHKLVKAAN